MVVTIKKIAELARVSRGTVDRALNKRGGVNKEVEERIIKIAKSLGYKPNLVAKSLATRGQKNAIGVLVCAEGNDFFSEVLNGVDAAAQEISDFGFTVKINKMRGFDVEDQLIHIKALEEDGISALAITPINDKKIRDKLNIMQQSGIPIVALNVDIRSKGHYVCWV